MALWSLRPVSHEIQSPEHPPMSYTHTLRQGSGSTPDLGHSGLGLVAGTVGLLSGLTSETFYERERK